MMGSGLALAQELVLLSVQPWELGWATVLVQGSDQLLEVELEPVLGLELGLVLV